VISIIWGLAAAFSLGVADFSAREAGRREGALTTLLYVQLIGSPLTIGLALASKDVFWSSLLSEAVLLGVGSGLNLTIGNILFYKALVKGPLLIVAPITSSFAAVTIVLSLASGEHPTLLQMIGMAVTLAGIILAAAASRGVAHEEKPSIGTSLLPWRSSGVALAIAAAVLFGISVWIMKFAALRLGSPLTVLVLRHTALLVMIGIFLFNGRSPQPRSWASLRWVAPVAGLDTLATWFINLGLQTGLASVVSVITSLYSVVTMVLGYTLLRERITRTQQIGIGVTLAGVVLASV
jgi:drug/metabolite transporter (DMT)-like permease